jgi:hypothetical protein
LVEEATLHFGDSRLLLPKGYSSILHVSLIFIGRDWCKVDSDYLGTKTLKQNKSSTLASLLFKITIQFVNTFMTRVSYTNGYSHILHVRMILIDWGWCKVDFGDSRLLLPKGYSSILHVRMILIDNGWCKVDSDWLGTKTPKQNNSVTLASLLFKITITFCEHFDNSRLLLPNGYSPILHVRSIFIGWGWFKINF